MTPAVTALAVLALVAAVVAVVLGVFLASVVNAAAQVMTR